MTLSSMDHAKEKLIGLSAEVIGVNQYGDRWVPFHASITMRGNVDDPIRLLFIKGSHPLPHLFGQLHVTAYLNGNQIETYVLPSASFTLEIPISCKHPYSTVELHTWEKFNPHEKLGGGDYRDLGFIAELIVPISERELTPYRESKQKEG